MAWNTYLIDPLYDENGMIDGKYVSNFSASNKLQKEAIKSIGSMYEFVFTVGGSFKEKFYLGATIGVPSINYYEFSEYTESEINDTTNNLRKMIYEEEISAYGIGYNIKVGAIIRLTDDFKIGASIHSPSFFNIEEDYNTSITTEFKDSILNYTMGYITPFNYNLVTPLKSSISASRIFNKIVLIAAEYEIINYSSAKYFTSGFDNENNTISSIYKNTSNIKLGGEINIKPIILRAGYSKFGSPFTEKDFSTENYSYGIGLNNGNYYLDATYVLSQSAFEQLLYNEDYINPIDLKKTNHSFILTLGFRY